MNRNANTDTVLLCNHCENCIDVDFKTCLLKGFPRCCNQRMSISIGPKYGKFKQQEIKIHVHAG